MTAPSSRLDAAGGVDLYWLPLGAGGHSVRLNGRVYEAVAARLERRPACDLYHAALEVYVPEGRFVIEQTPVPDANGAARGVVAGGAVGQCWAGRLRIFRYEVRCWRDGVIPDVAEAVASPQRLSDDPQQARRLLDLVPSVPTPVWGRDELGVGEMWNSNSVISWLIARSGMAAETIPLPAGGRAPGWAAGLAVAHRQVGGAPPLDAAAPEIRRLASADVHEHLDGLARVLEDCVTGGASVSYLAPFSHDDARGVFEAFAVEVEQGRRLLLAAFAGGEVVGTVQVILAVPPNQPHRAEIAKLLVHRSARRRGIAERLMERAEAEARAEGKTLLVLDTVTGDAAERLYERLGWSRVGVIPGYALYPDGRPCDTTVFWKSL